MNRNITMRRPWVLGMAGALAGLCVSASAQQAQNTPEQEQPQQQNPLVEEVQGQVEQQTQQQASEQRQETHEEALAALREAERALRALDNGDGETALEAIERAVGKLQIILARSPDLALAPVGATVTQIDVFMDPDSIRDAIKRAREFLSDGRVQKARRLLSTLASEVVISESYLPLATFPSDLAEVAPLIDQGKLDLAEQRLVATLSTVVVVDRVIPLPIVRAELLLDNAEQLASSSGRSEADSTRLRDLLRAAREQIKMAELLGYGDKEDFKVLYRELDEIEKQTRGDRSGEGLFEGIRERLSQIRRRLFG